MEQALGGPYLPVAMLPEKDKILLAKMESRLPLEIFEEVLRAATDACQQAREEGTSGARITARLLLLSIFYALLTVAEGLGFFALLWTDMVEYSG